MVHRVVPVFDDLSSMTSGVKLTAIAGGATFDVPKGSTTVGRGPFLEVGESSFIALLVYSVHINLQFCIHCSL